MSFLEGNAHSDKGFASDAMFKLEIRDEMLVACIVLYHQHQVPYTESLQALFCADFHLIHGHIT